jgi:hypothetical protein
MTVFFNLTWPTVGNSSCASPASRTRQEACQRSPFLLGQFNGSKWWWKIEFSGYLGFNAFLNLRAKMRAQLAGIYRGFGTYA